jgi:hypothetical protein
MVQTSEGAKISHIAHTDDVCAGKSHIFFQLQKKYFNHIAFIFNE